MEAEILLKGDCSEQRGAGVITEGAAKILQHNQLQIIFSYKLLIINGV